MGHTAPRKLAKSVVEEVWGRLLRCDENRDSTGIAHRVTKAASLHRSLNRDRQGRIFPMFRSQYQILLAVYAGATASLSGGIEGALLDDLYLFDSDGRLSALACGVEIHNRGVWPVAIMGQAIDLCREPLAAYLRSLG